MLDTGNKIMNNDIILTFKELFFHLSTQKSIILRHLELTCSYSSNLSLLSRLWDLIGLYFIWKTHQFLISQGKKKSNGSNT